MKQTATISKEEEKRKGWDWQKCGRISSGHKWFETDWGARRKTGERERGNQMDPASVERGMGGGRALLVGQQLSRRVPPAGTAL